MLQTIAGREGASISSLAWTRGGPPGSRGRLFSSGLDGFITEWDLSTGRPKASVDSYGGPVWCIAAEPLPPPPVTHPHSDPSSGHVADTRLAVACDDGALRVFVVEASDGSVGAPTGAQYAKSFPRVKGRILCTAWHPSRNALVAGDSEGIIRLWDLTTTRELLKIDVGDVPGKGKAGPCCVWSLLALRDGTIVSGDGAGRTQFWEGKFGTLLQGHRQHSADVLALTALPAGDVVFAAGVDNKVVQFQNLPDRSRGDAPEWVYVGGRRWHTHDVRALAVVVPRADASFSRLVSGGNDAQLITYAAASFLQYAPMRVCCAPQPPPIHLAHMTAAPPIKHGSKKKGGGAANRANGAHGPSAAMGDARPLLLSQHATWLDIWRLGAATAAAQGGADASTHAHGSSEEDEPSHSKASPKTKTPGKRRKVAALGVVAASPNVRGRSHQAAGDDSDDEPATAPLANGLPMNGAHRMTGSGDEGEGERARADASGGGAPVTLRAPPQHLARIRKTGPWHITCSALSPDGRHVACSDVTATRIFRVVFPIDGDAATDAASGRETDAAVPGVSGDTPGLSVRIEKVKCPAGVGPATQLAFTADSTRLLVATVPSHLLVLDMRTDAPVVLHVFTEHLRKGVPGAISAAAGGGRGGVGAAGPEPSASKSSAVSAGIRAGHAASISTLTCSPDGQWAAFADITGLAHVCNLELLRLHASLPLLEGAAITALAFHPDSCHLALATAGGKVHVYDVEARELNAMGKGGGWGGCLPAHVLGLGGTIEGVCFVPQRDAYSLLVYSRSAFCLLDLTKPLLHDDEQRRAHKPVDVLSTIGGFRGVPGQSMTPLAKLMAQEEATDNGRVVELEQPCLYIGFMGADSALMVEKRWSDVLCQFPAPLYRHRYGT
eukprot:jgi/Mesvir1/22744/Mv14147-RA.1